MMVMIGKTNTVVLRSPPDSINCKDLLVFRLPLDVKVYRKKRLLTDILKGKAKLHFIFNK